MDRNEALLEQLKSLIKQKQSKTFYAEKLGIGEFEIGVLLRKIRMQKLDEIAGIIEDTERDFKEMDKGLQSSAENKEKGTSEIKFLHTKEVLSEDEIWAETKMDRKKWKFVQVYHKKYGRGFLYTANFRIIPEESKEKFQDRFIDFLSTYSVIFPPREPKTKSIHKKNIALILPKQDAHYNKWDMSGENNIYSRFGRIHSLTEEILANTEAIYNIDKIVYVVGSDQFNSEWTGMTTKGTPQTNILTYQEAFKEITRHEIGIINTLLEQSNDIEIVYIPGNHDEYVGWHLISWLEAYYKEEENITFNSSIQNTKYLKYGNSAIMLNHGDDIKPNDLAHMFPVNFNEEWSKCNYYYIFTGDRHNELSLDIHGIKFFQVPQLSNAKSKWDDKKGYTSNKAEMNAFVITQDIGLSTIFKPIL